MRNRALRRFRLAQELTQEETAAKIGVKMQTYARIEQGKTLGSIEFWCAFEKAFNLVGGEVFEIMTYCVKSNEGGCERSDGRKNVRC